MAVIFLLILIAVATLQSAVNPLPKFAFRLDTENMSIHSGDHMQALG